MVNAIRKDGKMNDYITTKELKNRIKELGLEYKIGAFNLYIEDNGHPVANVDLYQPLQIDTLYDTLNYKNPTHRRLYKLISRFALTPPNKRIKEKKYRLKLDISDEIVIFDGKYRYLAKSKQFNTYYCLSLAVCGKAYQNIFTQAEIDDMGDLTKGFVKEEVCEN